MGEAPRRACSVGVAAAGGDDRRSGVGFDAGRESCSIEGAVGHQPVQVGVFQSPGAVGAPDGGQRIARALGGCGERLGLLDETGSDDRRFQVGFVGDVLVERRSLNAEPVGDRSHRDCIRSAGLEEVAGDADDLVETPAWSVRHVHPSFVRRPNPEARSKLRCASQASPATKHHSGP